VLGAGIFASAPASSSFTWAACLLDAERRAASMTTSVDRPA
jgi:hypothetical protein